jgi:hypothetical protein
VIAKLIRAALDYARISRAAEVPGSGARRDRDDVAIALLNAAVEHEASIRLWASNKGRPVTTLDTTIQCCVDERHAIATIGAPATSLDWPMDAADARQLAHVLTSTRPPRPTLWLCQDGAQGYVVCLADSHDEAMSIARHHNPSATWVVTRTRRAGVIHLQHIACGPDCTH